MNKEMIYLAEWHHSVSVGNESVLIYTPQFNIKLSHTGNVNVNNVDGWYAMYPEGIFYIFKSLEGEFFIGWNDCIVACNDIERVDWLNKKLSLEFICYDYRRNVILNFEYETLKQYLKKPLKFLYDIFVPDDEAGLISDLPSFIHSAITKDKLKFYFSELMKREQFE